MSGELTSRDFKKYISRSCESKNMMFSKEKIFNFFEKENCELVMASDGSFSCWLGSKRFDGNTPTAAVYAAMFDSIAKLNSKQA